MLDFRLLMGKVGEGDSGKARVEEETQGHKAPSQSRPSALKEDYEHTCLINLQNSSYKKMPAMPVKFLLVWVVFFFFFGPKKYIPPNSWHDLISFGCACFAPPPPTYSFSKEKEAHSQ